MASPTEKLFAEGAPPCQPSDTATCARSFLPDAQDNCSKLFELNLSPRLRYPCSCLLTPALHALL